MAHPQVAVAISGTGREVDRVARAPGRFVLVRSALAEAGRAALGRWRGLRRSLGRTRRPDRLLFAPQDLRVTDPALAADIAEGLFAPSPPPAPGSVGPEEAATAEARAADLYGLGWLRHLRMDDRAVRDAGRALAVDILVYRSRALDRGPGASRSVVARRLASMLAHSPRVLAGAEHRLYRVYLGRIGRDAAALRAGAELAARPLDRLAAAIGLCLASLCCAGFERGLRRATRLLSREIEAQILPDGGHVGRNPATVVDLLLDLLPLRLLYASRSVEVPPALEGAIDRMLPALRFFRHGSGDLALFNGMGRTPSPELAAVLAQDRTRAAPAERARASGYDRMEAGRTVAIVDTGGVPPLAASAAAHAGFLSFELSSGTERIVVNAGAPAVPGRARAFARTTAAHSTLVVDGRSSAMPLDSGERASRGWSAAFLRRRLGPVLLPGPTETGAERGRSGDDHVLTAHHDGYRGAFGIVHTRRLRLSADGSELEGEDAVGVSAAFVGRPVEALLRFHLHPSVRAEPEEASGGLLLTLANGERWRFGAEGARPRLEPGLLYAVTEGRRPTRQIVLPLERPADVRTAALRWIFVRA